MKWEVKPWCGMWLNAEEVHPKKKRATFASVAKEYVASSDEPFYGSHDEEVHVRCTHDDGRAEARRVVVAVTVSFSVPIEEEICAEDKEPVDDPDFDPESILW